MFVVVVLEFWIDGVVESVGIIGNYVECILDLLHQNIVNDFDLFFSLFVIN
jgi:hypothetical protein